MHREIQRTIVEIQRKNAELRRKKGELRHEHDLKRCAPEFRTILPKNLVKRTELSLSYGLLNTKTSKTTLIWRAAAFSPISKVARRNFTQLCLKIT